MLWESVKQYISYVKVCGNVFASDLVNVFAKLNRTEQEVIPDVLNGDVDF
jgi:hypothetical protein